MKRKRFEELLVKLHRDVVEMIDRDESEGFIQSYLVKAVTTHSPRDNPNFTARQLAMIFDMCKDTRKEHNYDDEKRKEDRD